MSDPFIGEVRAFPYTFQISPDMGWLPCLGQQLQLSQYQPLYAIIGDLYLPAGRSPSTSSFFLPNLSQQAVLGAGISPVSGNQYPVGRTVGVGSVTLSASQLPAHTHQLQRHVGAFTKTSAPSSTSEFVALTAAGSGNNYTATTTVAPTVPLQAVIPYGYPSPTSHSNAQPYLAMMYYIAYMGIFPTRP